MILPVATGKIGQHHAGARNTERLTEYLIEQLGKNTLITEIGDDDVAKLVARRGAIGIATAR